MIFEIGLPRIDSTDWLLLSLALTWPYFTLTDIRACANATKPSPATVSNGRKLRTFQDKLLTWWCVASLACATLRVELQLQPDTGGESCEDQISNVKNERACHKAMRQHRLQCRSMLSNNFMTSRVSSAVCHSLSHCAPLAAVDLIGHWEICLQIISLLSNQYRTGYNWLGLR